MQSYDRSRSRAAEAGAVKPQRIQLSRAKGFRLQEASLALNGLACVKVDRSTIFGNLSACNYAPGGWCSRCSPKATYCCIDKFREYVTSGIEGRDSRGATLNVILDAGAGYPRRTKLIARLPELRGKNVACWCALDRPCHADVLLE